MSFLNILAGICILLVIGLVVLAILFELENRYESENRRIVIIYSPMGFLFCIHYTCRYLSVKRKRPNAKKPWNDVIKCFDYFLLVFFIIQICAYLMKTGMDNNVLLLLPAVTYCFAVAAVFFYIEESRKGAPLEKGEEQPSEIHG